MRKFTRSVIASVSIFGATIVTVEPADAQGYRDYCHQRAQDLSGYRGGRGGGIVGGAVKGAIGGAIISGILGGKKKDRKKAAKLGALLGGLSAASKPNSRAARIYRLEFEACMRQR